MSARSLRKDHDLIEKILKSMWAVISLLNTGKTIPASILMPVIDFTKNFTDVCHHSKEENSLFPELEKKGMSRSMEPIAVMLMKHVMTRKIAERIEESSQVYLKTGDSSQLITNMGEYVNHVTQHLWKENNRLFMMADMVLQDIVAQVDQSLHDVEQSKLNEIGKSREDYEKLAYDLDKKISEVL